MGDSIDPGLAVCSQYDKTIAEEAIDMTASVYIHHKRVTLYGLFSFATMIRPLRHKKRRRRNPKLHYKSVYLSLRLSLTPSRQQSASYELSH
jgi:hypothetical protein